MVERSPERLFAPANVELKRRPDDSLILRSTAALQPHARCVGDWLEQWGATASDRVFLAERAGDGWQTLRYGEALVRVRRIAAWLLRQELSPHRPVAILSDNSIEHALLALAAMHIGVPVVPVSPAYSLVSRDFGKLRSIFAATTPGVVYAADSRKFQPALDAVADLHDGPVIVQGSVAPGEPWVSFADITGTQDDAAVAAAFAAVTPDTVAKLLFTSGSTGAPKGVINTQRMLCANQQQILQVWPFSAVTPPVIVDWLPWNHTFGGNYNFNLILRSGGTLYIDDGRPAPALFHRTIANLREISPTIYFNVPRGFDLLVAALRADASLREAFFSKLQVIMYAAAALPQHLWEALEQLARETTGSDIALVSAWGSTETSPVVTSCHFRAERAGVIGIPVPGCELKLVPNGPKLEARVRGPQVTPGYWQQPELTAQAFDTEGFYRIGDALRLLDPLRPELGVVFDGRVAEDFKLATGTWVNAGGIRVKALSALAPLVQDLVVTGHDRDEIGLLLFPNIAECRASNPELPPTASIDVLLQSSVVRQKVLEGLRSMHRDSTGSSTFATRALLMQEPPSVDAGEITDKAYINQGLVLARRSALVEALYSSPCGDSVICL